MLDILNKINQPEDLRNIEINDLEKLSEEIDVATAFLSRVERGHSQINLKRLAQISKALDVPLEKLVTGTDTCSDKYLDKELYNILINCTPDKQKLIYNIAKIVSGSDFV